MCIFFLTISSFYKFISYSLNLLLLLLFATLHFTVCIFFHVILLLSLSFTSNFSFNLLFTSLVYFIFLFFIFFCSLHVVVWIFFFVLDQLSLSFPFPNFALSFFSFRLPLLLFSAFHVTVCIVFPVNLLCLGSSLFISSPSPHFALSIFILYLLLIYLFFSFTVICLFYLLFLLVMYHSRLLSNSFSLSSHPISLPRPSNL